MRTILRRGFFLVFFAINLMAQTAPSYRFDGGWPKLPLPNKWTFGGVTGLTVGKDDVVWVLHRPNDLNQSQNYATLTPPTAECCVKGPAVLAFDTDNLEQATRRPAEFHAPDAFEVQSGQPTGLAISPDGSRIYVSVNGTSQILTFDANAIISGPQTPAINLNCQPNALALTPDGARAIVAGTVASGGVTPGIVSIVNLATQSSIDLPTDGTPSAVVISADGKRAFVEETTAKARMWIRRTS